MARSWKTTSAGILLIAGGLVRLYFAIKSGGFTEESVLSCLTAILGGVGLLSAKDGDITGVGDNAKRE